MTCRLEATALLSYSYLVEKLSRNHYTTKYKKMEPNFLMKTIYLKKGLISFTLIYIIAIILLK